MRDYFSYLHNLLFKFSTDKALSFHRASTGAPAGWKKKHWEVAGEKIFVVMANCFQFARAPAYFCCEGCS